MLAGESGGVSTTGASTARSSSCGGAHGSTRWTSSGSRTTSRGSCQSRARRAGSRRARAQAIAARSYALTTRVGSEFDLYGDTRSQAYEGVGARTPSTDAAISATAAKS